MFKLAAAGILTLIASTAAMAQTATQTVTFQVDAINQISVAGAVSLDINSAMPAVRPPVSPPASAPGL